MREVCTEYYGNIKVKVRNHKREEGQKRLKVTLN